MIIRRHYRPAQDRRASHRLLRFTLGVGWSLAVFRGRGDAYLEGHVQFKIQSERAGTMPERIEYEVSTNRFGALKTQDLKGAAGGTWRRSLLAKAMPSHHHLGVSSSPRSQSGSRSGSSLNLVGYPTDQAPRRRYYRISFGDHLRINLFPIRLTDQRIGRSTGVVDWSLRSHQLH